MSGDLEAPAWIGQTEIDPRFWPEYVAYGLSELLRVTTNEWRYRDWCRRTGRDA